MKLEAPMKKVVRFDSQTMKQIICLSICLMMFIARADWTPPNNVDSDFEKLLQDAQADTAAQNFLDARQKYHWVNLAISNPDRLAKISWAHELAYMPTLEQMKSSRDKSTQNLRDEKAYKKPYEGDTPYSAIVRDFQTVLMNNRTLGEDTKTVELFIWMDATKPDFVKSNYLFVFAMPILIQAKEYKLCNKYFGEKGDYWRNQILYQYERTELIAGDEGPKKHPHLLDFGRKQFCNRTAAAVAILVSNGRKNDAQQIIAEATEKLNDTEFKKQLEKAFTGDMPPPWPSPWG